MIKKYYFFTILMFFISSSLFAVENQNLYRLNETINNQEYNLTKYVVGEKDYTISESMKALNELVVSATERVNIFITWDEEEIRNNAEELFDETIQAIEEYLELIAIDGPVNKTVTKIKTVALNEASSNRKKGNRYKSFTNQKFFERYFELAKKNEKQAELIEENWQLIIKERERATAALDDLKLGRELYIDIAMTEGIDAAIGQMELMTADLVTLSTEMTKMKDKILDSTIY